MHPGASQHTASTMEVLTDTNNAGDKSGMNTVFPRISAGSE